MKLSEARALAERAIELLRPGCERIEIAGSVRREKPECKDIELVCAPRISTRLDPDLLLFGGYTKTVTNHLWNLIDESVRQGILRYAGYVDKNGKVTQRAHGDKYRGVEFCDTPGTKIEIFTVPSLDDWGVNFTIRTGSAEFSHEFVTQASRASTRRIRFGRLWRLKHPDFAAEWRLDNLKESRAAEIAAHIPCPEERNWWGMPNTKGKDAST